MIQDHTQDHFHATAQNGREETQPSESAPLFENAPFVVEHYREGIEKGAIFSKGAAFRPAARLVLTSTLRTAGLWSLLPAEELRDLVLMLTFLTPNGRVQPTLPELAAAMQVSSVQARARMLRLSRRQWQGRALVRELTRQNGLDAYLPAHHVVSSYQEPEDIPQSPAPVPMEVRAGREALVAHSRSQYAAPRAVVEADIASRMGWGPPVFESDPPEIAAQKRLLYERLSEQGMTKNQALDILSRFDLSIVSCQLDWLPHRGAKNPSRYLQAAIESNYEAPVAVRVQQAEISQRA